MLAIGLLLGAITLGPGLGLAADDEPVPPPNEPAPAPPAEPGGGVPGAALLLGLGAVAAVLASQRPGSALGLRPPADAMVVFVPGHGQGLGQDVFREFVDLMGIDPEDARYFDYRWVTGDADPHHASMRAPVEPTAASLNAYLAGVADGERPVWLIGFSKGGTAVAELVAAWDDGIFGPTANVEGAMLLDPPMAKGVHGALQSVGRMVGPIPDDGGYDPVGCAFLWFGCHDARAHLGEDSGIEVIVVRNPRAGITSFGDRPPGLRVIDAPDDGPGPWGQIFQNPLRLPARLAEAHESVLSDPAVVRCLVSEMWKTGTCELEAPRLGSLRMPARYTPAVKAM